MTSLDSFKCRKILKVGSKSYVYYSLRAAEEAGLTGTSSLPISMKVLLENLLRNEDSVSVNEDDLKAVAAWLKNKGSVEHEIAFDAVPLGATHEHLSDGRGDVGVLGHDRQHSTSHNVRREPVHDDVGIPSDVDIAQFDDGVRRHVPSLPNHRAPARG